MSTGRYRAYHPEKKEYEMALWIHNWFGDQKFGIRFDDGTYWRQRDVEKAESNSNKWT